MNQRKQNISRWYMLGLAAILVMGCLITSVGTTFARYRIDRVKDIEFISEIPVQLALGNMEEAETMGEGTADGGIFVPDDTLEWREEMLTITEGETVRTKKVYALDVAVSNYLADGIYDTGDIRVKVRLIGSQDAWDRSAGAEVVLKDGTVTEDNTPRELKATVSPILRDTALYHSFGMGWEFRFLDAYGEELTWTLKGGQLSCVEFNFTIDAAALTGTSLLQLQFVGDRVAQ